MKIISEKDLIEIVQNEKIKTHQSLCCCKNYYACYARLNRKFKNCTYNINIAYLCKTNLPEDVKRKIIKKVNISIWEEEEEKIKKLIKHYRYLNNPTFVSYWEDGRYIEYIVNEQY